MQKNLDVINLRSGALAKFLKLEANSKINEGLASIKQLKNDYKNLRSIRRFDRN